MITTSSSNSIGTVSVIIPAYKAAHTIRRAIDGVLAQTVPPNEIIVIDDGSPDNQHEVIREYGHLVTLIRQPNCGASIARNAGLDRAQGDYVAFLDADDYWEPQKLERQLAAFTEHPEVSVVGSSHFVEKPGCQRSATEIRDPDWHDRVLRVQGARAFRVAAMLWTGTIMVRREVLGEERFMPGLEPAEDRDMWVRLVLQGPVYLISEPLSTAVLEPGSISRSNIDRDCSKMLEVIQRHRKTLGSVGTLTWRSFTLYRWAGMDFSPKTALPRLMRSFALWPLPYFGLKGMRPLGRAKRLVVLLMLALRIRPTAKCEQITDNV